MLPIFTSTIVDNEYFISFQDDEPPEITYCVVENTGTLTLQAITPTQPMPSQEELDTKFAELVVSSHLKNFK